MLCTKKSLNYAIENQSFQPIESHNMTSNPYFLHHYLAEQMDNRLDLVRHNPQHIVLAGADLDFSRQKLAARYPQAQFVEYDPHEPRLAEAAAQRKPSFINKLLGKQIAQHCQSPHDTLPENHADMLWANLNLVWSPNIIATLENWANALKPNAMLFFTHFGAASLPEIRELIHSEPNTLIDMHDLGDMLFHHGFYDPIMDTATVVLDYHDWATLQHDLQFTGLWCALNVADEVAAWQTLQHAWQAGKLRQISIEILHGHALKKFRLPENQSVVQFYPRKPQ